MAASKKTPPAAPAPEGRSEAKARPRRKRPVYDREEKEAIIEAVLARMEAGQSAYSSCGDEGVPYMTFSDWMNETPERAGEYARAKEGVVLKLAEEVERISDEVPPLGPDGKVDGGWIQKHRLQVDTRKWLLAKLAPKKYGERLEVAGDASSPLQAAVTVSFVKGPAK